MDLSLRWGGAWGSSHVYMLSISTSLCNGTGGAARLDGSHGKQGTSGQSQVPQIPRLGLLCAQALAPLPTPGRLGEKGQSTAPDSSLLYKLVLPLPTSSPFL